MKRKQSSLASVKKSLSCTNDLVQHAGQSRGSTSVRHPSALLRALSSGSPWLTLTFYWQHPQQENPCRFSILELLVEWLRPEIDHTCGAKAKSALGTRRAWGEPHKQAVPALGSQGVQASQAHSVSGRWLKLTSTSWMCKQRCEALSSSFPPSRIEGSTWPQPSLSSLYFSVLSLPLLAETFYTSRWMLQNWWLCSAEWAKTEGCGEAKNFILFFFGRTRLGRMRAFLYWFIQSSFIESLLTLLSYLLPSPIHFCFFWPFPGGCNSNLTEV